MSISSRLQRIVTTAVPHGRTDSGDLVIGVHVSPRLSFDGAHRTTLDQFPDWMSWPKVSKTFAISLDGGHTFTPVADARVRTGHDVDLWRAIFRADLSVEDHDGHPGADRTFGGYSYDTLATALREVYQKPVLGQSQLGQAASQISLRQPVPTRPPAHDPAGALAQHVSFMRPYQSRPQPRIADDFHRRLSTLNDHPGLMQRLGLIATLTIPAPELMPTVVAVRLTIPAVKGVHTRYLAPLTRMTSAAGSGGSPLLPALRDPETTEYDPGLRLRLDSSTYFTLHDGLDVDLAAARVLGVAQQADGPTKAPPAPATTGMILSRSDRAPVQEDRVSAARDAALKMLQSPPVMPTLYAEDLIAGHAFQVRRAGTAAAPGPWLSLSNRHMSYRATMPDGTKVSFASTDEAPVTTGARRADPGSDKALLVSDVVARWDGWSLAVPEPGETLLEGPDGLPSMDTEQGRFPGTYLTMRASVPAHGPDGEDGRLPVLRYGAAYEWRGRAVDITGWAAPWGGEPSSGVVTYRRWEPASSPTVLAPAELTPGETARRVVIRSDPNALRELVEPSSRVLVPPRVPVETGLRHGLFDTPTGAPDAAAYATIGALDAQHPPKHAPATDGLDPSGVAVRWLPDPMLTSVHLSLPAVGQRDVTFLPAPGTDPLGKASLGSWQSVALYLRAADGSSAVLNPNQDAGDLTVVPIDLPQAMRATLTVRAQPRAERILEHGLPTLQPGPDSNRITDVHEGRMLQLTPVTEIELVHAVKAPLTAPGTTVDDLFVSRGAGQKDAAIAVITPYEGASTGRLTVRATWSEPVDNGARLRKDPDFAPPELDVHMNAVLGERELVPDHKQTPRVLQWSVTAPFADLRRRDLTVEVVATSSFVPEFRQALSRKIEEAPSGSGTYYVLMPSDVDIESAILVHQDGTPFARGTDYTVAVPPGRSRRAFRLRPGIVPRSVVLQGVVGTVLASSGELTGIIVPSAVRPAPPKALYAVPAFAIDPGHVDTDGTARAGRGRNRLRVWLERPWWTSGEQEKLAVVISADTTVDDHQSPLGRRVTAYGRDPIRMVNSYLYQQQDLVSGSTISGVPLVEDDIDPGTTVTVANHDVSYDPDRDLYYADVEFEDQPAGTFVRLALARYQEHTVDGVPQLSGVVTLDPVELMPARTVSATRSGSDLVVSFGGVPRSVAQYVAPVVKVSIQQQQVDAGPDLGWRTVKRVVKAPDTTGASEGSPYPDVTLAYPPTSSEPYRILVEELDVMVTRDGFGNPVPWGSKSNPTTGVDAINDLVGIRPQWVATLPLP